MGAQISRTENEFVQEVIAEQKQVCPQVNCSNVADVGPIDISNTNINTALINQECNITVECLYNGTIDILAKIIQQANSKANGGLGIQYSEARTIAKRRIELVQQQIGSKVVSENKAKIESITITNSTLNAPLLNQIGNIELRQVFQAITKEAVDISQDAQAEASGWTLFGSGWAVLGIALLVVLGLGGFWLFKKEKKEEQVVPVQIFTGGGVMGIWPLIILGIVGLIVGAIMVWQGAKMRDANRSKLAEKGVLIEGYRQVPWDARNIAYYLRHTPPYY